MSKQALSKLRVIEIGHALSAPFTAQLLGDFGAEIIKVERPAGGDLFRTVAAPFPLDAKGNKLDSSGFLAANRNKKSITVDITKPAGQEVVRKLVQSADVVIENLKPGDLARYSLDYENVKKLNPGIVYLSISGFGQTGPYAKRGGLDGVFQYMSGLCSITGEPDGPPQRVGFIVSDTITSLYTTVAIITALYHRNQNGGPGQYIDMALLDAQIAALSHRAESYLISGNVPMRSGNGTPASFPSDLFRCADGLLFISASPDAQYKRFCLALGRPELLEDPRFNVRRLRYENRKALTEAIEQVLAGRGMKEWVDIFADANVIAAPIYNLGQTFADPHVQQRNVLVDVPHPVSESGKVTLLRSPIRLSETPIDYRAPPTMGQHNEEILGGLLGMDEATLKSLKDQKVV